jgi:hypothetical protein
MRNHPSAVDREQLRATLIGGYVREAHYGHDIAAVEKACGSGTRSVHQIVRAKRRAALHRCNLHAGAHR